MLLYIFSVYSLFYSLLVSLCVLFLCICVSTFVIYIFSPVRWFLSIAV